MDRAKIVQADGINPDKETELKGHYKKDPPKNRLPSVNHER
jgi:hypothetical protein